MIYEVCSRDRPHSPSEQTCSVSIEKWQSSLGNAAAGQSKDNNENEERVKFRILQNQFEVAATHCVTWRTAPGKTSELTTCRRRSRVIVSDSDEAIRFNLVSTYPRGTVPWKWVEDSPDVEERYRHCTSGVDICVASFLWFTNSDWKRARREKSASIVRGSWFRNSLYPPIMYILIAPPTEPKMSSPRRPNWSMSKNAQINEQTVLTTPKIPVVKRLVLPPTSPSERNTVGE